MRILLVAFLLSSAAAVAQDDSGILIMTSEAIVVPLPVEPSPDAGASPVVSLEVDAGVVSPVAAIPGEERPIAYAQIIFKAVASGDWWAAASALLVLIVVLLRKYGRWLHEKIPDTNPIDKVFWFLLDTKPGGWLLNFLTAISGGVGTSLLAGVPITWAIVKPVLLVSITGASLWELVKDIGTWIANKKAPPAA